MTLKNFIKQTEDTMGKGSVMTLTDTKPIEIDTISTGIKAIDDAVGIGGLPIGKITEIFGAEGTLKTTLCLHTIAEANKQGKMAAFVDAEHALNLDMLKRLGVDTTRIVLSQPDSGEQALEMVELMVKSHEFAVVVVDSVAALTPQAEIDKDMGESVSYDTPIIVRDKRTKEIDIVSIKSLYKGRTNFIGKRYTNKYKKTKRKEVLTHKGWSQLKAVFYKKNHKNKKIVITNTLTGSVTTTPDHCLFKNKKEVSPKELTIGEKIDQSDFVLTETKGYLPKDLSWFLGFFCAEGHKINNTSFNVCETRPEVISHCEEIVSKNFTCKTKIKKIIQKGNRVPLYQLTICTNSILRTLLEDCIDETGLKKVPKVILNDTKTHRSFIKGFKEGDGSKHLEKDNLYSSSQILMSGLALIMKSMNKKFSLHVRSRENKPEYFLQSCKKHLFEPKSIRRFIETKTPKYLYDIETSDGTFVGGVGNVVLHNSSMGVHARLMSQAMRKLTAPVGKSPTAVVFINQTRSKIGFMGGTTTTGGNALKFYASLRLEMKYTGKIVNNAGEKIAGKFKCTVVKNKFATPYKVVNFESSEYGIDTSNLILERMLKSGELEQAGSFYKRNGETVAQGKTAIKNLIRSGELV